MRQRIYREEQPDQVYEEPPEGSNGVWADLFMWGMRQGAQPTRQHWQSIHTEEAIGNPIQERYNFTLHEITASTFPEMVRYLYRQQSIWQIVIVNCETEFTFKS
jgi:hypothetical protein